MAGIACKNNIIEINVTSFNIFPGTAQGAKIIHVQKHPVKFWCASMHANKFNKYLYQN
jgi:hypothetical protein